MDAVIDTWKAPVRWLAILMLLLLAACGPAGSGPTAVPTAAGTPTTTGRPVRPEPVEGRTGDGSATPATAPTATLAASAVPVSTSAPSPSPSPLAVPSPTVAVSPAPAAEPYLDDRSSGPAALRSFVNALNLHQTVRAYSYWQPNQQPDFSQFQAQWADVASLSAQAGPAGFDIGAGQQRWAIPAVFQARLTDGATRATLTCTVLHLGLPSAQAVPPFQPVAIESMQQQPLAAGVVPATPPPSLCPQGGEPAPPTPAVPPDDVSTGRYLDDRSDPVALLRSLANAINRHEYLRAFSYWQPDAPGLAPYDQFAQGYADTQRVSLLTGPVASSATASEMDYAVPVVLQSVSTAGAQQAFAGCYRLRLVRPEQQTQPPFQGLRIQSASVQPAPADAQPSAAACA